MGLNNRTGWWYINGKLAIRFEKKWQDVWVGAYWHRSIGGMDIWICILPTLPIHIRIFKVNQWQ